MGSRRGDWSISHISHISPLWSGHSVEGKGFTEPSRVFVQDSSAPVSDWLTDWLTDWGPAGKSISYFNCEESSRLGVRLGHQGQQGHLWSGPHWWEDWDHVVTSTKWWRGPVVHPCLLRFGLLLMCCQRKYLNIKNISDVLFRVIFFRMNEDHQSVLWKRIVFCTKRFLQVYFNCAGSFPTNNWEPAPCSLGALHSLPPSNQAS